MTWPVNRAMWLAAAVIQVVLLATCGEIETRHTNVLLISLDTTRRDHLSSYGYPRRTTPHLDRLAEGALLFERAVSVSNWTLPTHASMLTGLYPRTHGAQRVGQDGTTIGAEELGRLEESCVTLAEVLSQEGFRTGAIVANGFYLQPKLGIGQGFDEFDYEQAGPPLYYRRAEEISERAISWIADARQAPFFLFLNYMDPHFPYLPPPPHDLRYSGETRLRTRFGTWQAFRDRMHTAKAVPLTEEEAAFFRDQYDAELNYMDEQIGRLLDRMRKMGLYESTMIVVVADHGEAFGEHGVVGHGATLYEHQTAIPLIIKLPQGEAPERLDVPVSQVDILPTVLGQLGLAVPQAVQGTSLLAYGPRDLFAEVSAGSEKAAGHRLAIFRDPLKYILSAGGGKELYDLRTDPGELNNLRDTDEGAGELLESSLRRWLAETPPVLRTSPPVKLSDAEERALRALGYIQ